MKLTNLKFEYVDAATIKQVSSPPRGEVGRVVDRGEGIQQVVFSSGCVLEVQPDPSSETLDVYRVTLIECERDEPFIILIRVPLDNRSQPYFMMPATMYGTNNADRGVVANHQTGTGGDPKLAYRANGVSGLFSHSWHFRADHVAVPSVSAMFDEQFVGLGIEEACCNAQGEWTYNGVGLWTHEQDGDSLTVSLGALDWPGRIVCHRLHPGRVVEPLTKDVAIGMTCRFCLYEHEAVDRFGYEPFVAGWYDVIHEPPREGAPLEQAMRDVAEAVSTDGVREETGCFHMFRHPDGIHDSATLLAWAGVLQIARPLILAGKVLDEPRYVEVAAEIVDRAVVEAVNPANGLFYDVHWQGRWQANNWWPDVGQTSLVNGHACYLLLKMAEDHSKHLRNPRKNWAHAAQAVLERVLPHQRDDGRFSHGFSPADGTPTGYDGFGGCFFAAPLLMLHRLYGNEAAWDAGTRAVEHYWKQFETLEWIGVDLDCAGAQDSGSSYALLRALSQLHRTTRDAQALERMGHVLHYAFTYRFGHNTHHRNPVCDWSSSGSKVTSTHNVHLDAYGGEILDDLYYYLQHVGDRYLQNRLDDSLAWARQAYNRSVGEYGWGKVGYSTEQYYHTYDRYQNHEGDGAVWTGYHSWSSGSLLNAYVVETMVKEDEAKVKHVKAEVEHIKAM